MNLKIRHGLGLGWAWAFCSLNAGAQTPKDELPQLQLPHSELPPTFWEQHGGQCVLGGIAALVLVLLLVYWLRRPRTAVVEAPDVAARRALEALRGQPENGALAMHVSRILRRYLLAALQVPPEELTTTEFAKALQSHPRFQPELAAKVAAFLRRCDEWKFAPRPAAPQLATVPSALALIDETETVIRHIQDAETARTVAGK